MSIENTIGWLLENNPRELLRQQIAAAEPCIVCGGWRIPFEGQYHTDCDNLIAAGYIDGSDINIFIRDDFTCQTCGYRGLEIEKDHIFPKSKGGSDNPENLQTLCRSCNAKKGDRWPLTGG